MSGSVPSGRAAAPPLILASASPRRRELLGRFGVAFEVRPSAAPEVPAPDETPRAFAERVAADKALDVARSFPGAVVIGADTIVVKDEIIFGKPRDRHDARRILRLLGGAAHEVMTGVAVVGPDGTLRSSLAVSRVEFRPLAAAEIETYLDTDEPYDKAGAYAIQGHAGAFVAAVEGARSNIVGMPLAVVAELFRPYYEIGNVSEDAE